MAKALKIIGTIAAGVALVATGLGAFGVAALGSTAGVAGSGIAWSTIATYASVAAGVASVGATLLTKPPPARGSVSQILIQSDAPQPYVMGEGYVGGVLRYDAAFGADGDTPNAYRWRVFVFSGGGPIQALPHLRYDFADISPWYADYLDLKWQLGACPESAALMPTRWTGAPGWTSASKLSGQAAAGFNMKFDKKGARYASGLPVEGAYGKWVKAYDPRKDSTFPGGSGAHRLGTESTYEWTANPALHFGTYAYGRYQNGKKTMGVGLDVDAIDWPTLAAWANVCDANSWTIFGRVFEPGNRWQNLKDIAMAGGADPCFSGGLLSVRYSAPQATLGTITEADLAAGQRSVVPMQSYAARINTIIPKYTSEADNWEQVPAEPVTVSTLVSEDGEERKQEWAFNLVKDVDQAAQLALYRIMDSRELSPIKLPLLPQWRTARPGECYHLDLPSLGLDHDAIVLNRQIDPATFGVVLTFASETPEKHDYALGKTGTPPPTPSIGQGGQTRDEAVKGAGNDPRYDDGTPIDDLKPSEADATNGAPPGTPVGTSEVTEVLNYLASIAVDTSTKEGLITGAYEDIDRLVRVARTGSGVTLNGNATFDEWPNGSGTLPEGWEDWHAGTINARVAGKEGLYGYRQTSPDTTTLMGLQRSIENIEAGYYEIDATFELVSGTLQGAAIYVDAFAADGTFIGAATAFDTGDYGPYLKISSAKDSLGATIGEGIANRLYRVRHLFKVVDGSVAKLRLYVQTNSEYFGPNAAKTMIWHRVALKATDGTGVLALDTRAIVSEQTGAISSLEGRTQAFWGVQGFAGEDAEFLIYARASAAPGEESSSEAGIIAKEFWISHPDVDYGYQRVFGVFGGNVYVLGKLIVDSVETNNLVNNAAVVPVAALLATPVSGSGGTSLASRLSATVHLNEPGTIRAICTMTQQFTSGTSSRPWNCELRVDGTLVPGAVSGGTVPGDSVTIHGTAASLAAGDHTIALYWDGHTTINLAAAVLSVEGFPKTS